MFLKYFCIILIIYIYLLDCEKMKFKSSNHPKSMKIDDCMIGDTFVINYLLYECHRWEILAKGYKIIGCVPSNHPNGTVVQIGKKVKDLFFDYICTRHDNTVTFKATGNSLII